jgi:hypothetical protein
MDKLTAKEKKAILKVIEEDTGILLEKCSFWMKKELKGYRLRLGFKHSWKDMGFTKEPSLDEVFKKQMEIRQTLETLKIKDIKHPKSNLIKMIDFSTIVGSAMYDFQSRCNQGLLKK